MGYLRARVRAEAQHIAACRRPRLRFLVAVVAAMGMLAIAAHSDVLRPVSPATHTPHAVASSLGGEYTVTIDHAHLDNGSSAAHHPPFPATMLTKSPSTTLAAFGLVAALVAVAVSLALLVPSGRGPPRGLAGALTGQDLLTRFCLSRR